jgi:2-phospho-L-lactate guanylyltransferase
MHFVNLAVLIPVKAFGDAKGRLAPVLGQAGRERLARWTATQVLAASAGLHPHVVCDDDDVAAWAVAHGAAVIREPTRGLNAAVDSGVAHLASQAFDHVVVVHGDLPLPASIAAVAAGCRADTVTLVPDRHRDGTNLLAFPLTSTFRVAYGPGSFARHVARAGDAGLAVHVVDDTDLALDLDRPDDLLHPRVQQAVATALGTEPAGGSTASGGVAGDGTVQP